MNNGPASQLPSVSILVVMDVALAELVVIQLSVKHYVSILVVMDVALADTEEEVKQTIRESQSLL